MTTIARGLAAALCLGLAGCTTAAAVDPTPRIVFASDRSGAGDIYLANLDGSGLRQLTTSAKADSFPRCSPDRSQVVFVRGSGEEAELVVLNLATGAERAITADRVRDATPGWSPDGTRIFFTRRDGTHDRLASIELDGSRLTLLTPAGVHNVMPAASPDGRRLVHHSYAFGRESELQILELASGKLSRITNHPGFDYEVAFAGADTVVFSSDRGGGHYRLYRQQVGAKDAELLADTGADSWGPRYSPRSGQLLFYTGSEGKWRIHTVPLSGGTPVAVLDDGRSNGGADWC